MGETADQIEAYIEDTRDDLGANLRELEQKVKSVTDWREQFRSNPLTMVGVAFGGGILLASVLSGSKRRQRPAGLSLAASAEPHLGTDHQKYRALETWDNIKGALIGVAATRFKDFVGDVVPGFHEQYERTEQKVKGIPRST